MSEAVTTTPTGTRFDVALGSIAIKLAWVADAMKTNDDHPVAEIIGTITAELDALVDPIGELVNMAEVAMATR